MSVYCFNKDVLVEQLQADADLGDQSAHDFGRDIIPRMYKTHRVFGYQYQGYWRDVGTVASYHQANMDLLSDPSPLNLDDPDLRLRTAGAIQVARTNPYLSPAPLAALFSTVLLAWLP